MTALPKKWMLADKFPALVAMDQVLKDYVKHAPHSYTLVRKEVRDSLQRRYNTSWVNASSRTRYFVSALLVELQEITGKTLGSKPDWADEDEADYKSDRSAVDAVSREKLATGGALSQSSVAYFGEAPTGPTPFIPPNHAGEVAVNIKVDALTELSQEMKDKIRASIVINSEFRKPTTKEETMSLINKETKLIETRIFINGVDASTLTDDQIFQAIGRAEHQIKELEMIENKPAKLGKKIEKAYKAIEKVKAYVDGR